VRVTGSLLRTFVVSVLSTIVLNAVAVEASAQPSDPQTSLAAIKGQIPAGEVIYVTDITGATIRGKLAAITDESVEVHISATVRKLRAEDVSRIQWEKSDSPLTGGLIGAGIGAIHGIYWLVADPNECTGLCAEDYVAIGVGAIVGGLIDRAMKKKVTVYDTALPKKTMVTISPFLIRDRRGLQLGLTF
jgi:hypothetical protein